MFSGSSRLARVRLWVGWCCSETDGEGLWWTSQYPEEMWLQALADMAQTYLSNPRVIGIDLRQVLFTKDSA